MSHTQARQTETVGERLKHEQPHFLPLPQFPPECCRGIPVKVSKTSLVQFETSRYSVPSQYAYQTLWLKAFVNRVEITTQTETDAVHERLSGKYQESICFEHYAKVLERKPGAQQHFRATNKKELPPKPPKSEPSLFPQVPVQPPNLAQYAQLLRSICMIQPQVLLLETHLKETAPAQYSQAVL